ncbi:MAG: hypothetical protein AAF997_01555 [Myxococcota bacterium]
MVTVESALREATATIRGNFGKLFLLVVGLFLPVFLLGVGLVFAIESIVGDDAEASVLPILLVAFGVLFGGYLMVQASAQVITVDHLSGRRPSFGRSVRVGFQHVLPIFGAAFLGALAYMLGLALLVVPGLIVITGLALTFPAIIFEGLGPLEGLNRSWALTKGYRWKVFLSFVAVYLITSAVTIPIQLLWAGAASFIEEGGTSMLAWIAFGVGGLLFSAIYIISTIYYCVLPGVLYLRIKEAREGLDIGALAAVFE